MALPTNAIVVLTPFQEFTLDDPDFNIRAYYFSCQLIPGVNHRLQHLTFGDGTVGKWEDYGLSTVGPENGYWTAGAPFTKREDGTFQLMEIFRIVADVKL